MTDNLWRQRNDGGIRSKLLPTSFSCAFSPLSDLLPVVHQRSRSTKPALVSTALSTLPRENSISKTSGTITPTDGTSPKAAASAGSLPSILLASQEIDLSQLQYDEDAQAVLRGIATEELKRLCENKKISNCDYATTDE